MEPWRLETSGVARIFYWAGGEGGGKHLDFPTKWAWLTIYLSANLSFV